MRRRTASGGGGSGGATAAGCARPCFIHGLQASSASSAGLPRKRVARLESEAKRRPVWRTLWGHCGKLWVCVSAEAEFRRNVNEHARKEPPQEVFRSKPVKSSWRSACLSGDRARGNRPGAIGLPCSERCKELIGGAAAGRTGRSRPSAETSRRPASERRCSSAVHGLFGRVCPLTASVEET